MFDSRETRSILLQAPLNQHIVHNFETTSEPVYKADSRNAQDCSKCHWMLPACPILEAYASQVWGHVAQEQRTLVIDNYEVSTKGRKERLRRKSAEDEQLLEARTSRFPTTKCHKLLDTSLY